MRRMTKVPRAGLGATSHIRSCDPHAVFDAYQRQMSHLFGLKRGWPYKGGRSSLSDPYPGGFLSRRPAPQLDSRTGAAPGPNRRQVLGTALLAAVAGAISSFAPATP